MVKDIGSGWPSSIGVSRGLASGARMWPESLPERRGRGRKNYNVFLDAVWLPLMYFRFVLALRSMRCGGTPEPVRR